MIENTVETVQKLLGKREDYPNNEKRNQAVALCLIWDKDVLNYSLEDMQETIERIKTNKISIGYDLIKYYIAIENNKTKGFEQAKTELFLDIPKETILNEMVKNLFLPPESKIINVNEFEKKKEAEKEVKVKKEKKEVLIGLNELDITVLKILTKVYGSESSAKSYCTKNKINPNSLEFIEILKNISTSSSKYKTNAKTILEELLARDNEYNKELWNKP